MMKRCTADDGETYVELNGMWYHVKADGKMEACSKPKILISCQILNQDKDKEFFTKHLVKKKGEK